MQGPGDIITAEDALFVRQQPQYLFRAPANGVGIAIGRLRVDAGARDRPALPIDLSGMHTDMFGRLDGQACLQVRAMIDADIVTRHRQMPIGKMLPRLAQLLQLQLRWRQVVGEKPSVLPLKQRLVAKTAFRHLPRRHHQMRMAVADIASFTWPMDRKVDGSAITIGEIRCKRTRQRQSLIRRQFVRQGDFEFPGNSGVTSLFRALGGIPQGRSLHRPIGRRPGRQDDLGMHDPCPVAKIMGQPIALVGQPLGRTIGGRRDSTSPATAGDRLHAEVVDRHRLSLVSAPRPLLELRQQLVSAPLCLRRFAPSGTGGSTRQSPDDLVSRSPARFHAQICE